MQLTQPLFIEPFCIPKPWGGRHLNNWSAKESEHQNIGELVLEKNSIKKI